MSFKSIAVWPHPAVQLGNTANESSDSHETAEAAFAVCRRLQSEGFGGDGKIFPISTRVEEDGKDYYCGSPTSPARCKRCHKYWPDRCTCLKPEAREAAIHADVFNPNESDREYYERRLRELKKRAETMKPLLDAPYVWKPE